MSASLPLATIPAALRTLPQWVCWRYEERNGKRTKPPISPHSNGKLLPAKTNNPATWSDFDTALATAERLKLNGVGLALAESDGLTGLDLDHVFDRETGELDPLAVEVLERFAGTYIEVSPSGDGLRIWCYGKPARSGKCEGPVKWLEVYAHPSNRYLTVTGNRHGAATAVTEQQAALDWLHSRFMTKTSTEGKRGASPSVETNLDDTALLNKARAARNGAAFDALWAGDLSAHGGDASSADLALCNLLAFWTNGDAARIDRLFRQSGLMRTKWGTVHDPASGRTYGQMTIDKAVAGCREGYSGRKPASAGSAPADDQAVPDSFFSGGDAASPRDRPAINLQTGRLPWTLAEIEEHLLTTEYPLFQRGCLTRITTEPLPTVAGIRRPAGVARMTPVSKPYLKHLLDTQFNFQKYDGRAKEWRSATPSNDLVERMLALSGHWKYRVITGIVTAPTLRPDGSLLDKPGYDPETGLYFDPAGETFPAIPDRPTREQGRAALDLLIKEVLQTPFADGSPGGFSFATPAARSAASSAILTALIRQTVPTAPLHLFSATRAGSGKTLLADAVALVATGKTSTIFDLAEDDDEQEKRMLSVFLAGDSVVNLDNVERPLGGKALCKALTAETFTGRVLGLSQNATVPTTATWLATGNNVVVKEDMTRRVVLCSLDPLCESPEKREYQRNLLEWIPANRPALVAAGLTALRAYVVAGSPKQAVPPMGSFEAWHRLVRSALIWLGEADPLGDTDKMESTDPTRQQLRSLLFAWKSEFGKAPATVKEATLRPAINDVLLDSFADVRGNVSTRSVGKFLSKMAGRIECGARFETTGISHQAACWRVVILDPRRWKGEFGEFGEFALEERGNLSVNNNSGGFSGGGNISHIAETNSPNSPNSPTPPVPSPVDTPQRSEAARVNTSSNSGDSSITLDERKGEHPDMDRVNTLEGDAKQLWGALKLYRGSETAQRLAQKLGWDPTRTRIAAQTLRTHGMATISADLIAPVHKGVRS